MVSQNLIDEAVRLTSTPGVHSEGYHERQRLRAAQHDAEIKEDISASRQIIQAMVDRIKTPVNLQEKYVSFDAMPSPLQRVVQAYIDAAAANTELDAAIKALAQTSPPLAS